LATEHLNIVDAQRHEVKHASTATLNQVLKSNGDGTTRFDSVAYSELSGVPSSPGYHTALYSSSNSTSQQPSATNTPLQVEFGTGGTSTDGSVTLSSAGLLTFNTAGYYAVTFFLRLGRTGTTGSAILFQRLLYNGAQTLNSNSITIDSNAQTTPFSSTHFFNAAAGDTLLMQILRDAAGNNDGGLLRTSTSASGWAPSPSASIMISKV
jgi:hypothetical protein